MKQIDGLISIARKAGFVIIGQDDLKGYSKKLYLILIDATAGKALRREVEFLSQKNDVTALEVEALGQSCGIENCKVIGIKNKAISEKIMEILKGV